VLAENEDENMLAFLLHLLLTAALLLLVANLVRGVEIGGWGPALLAALVLGLVNAVVRPLMVFLTFPLTIITLGLFLFVINALVLWLVAALVPGMRIRGFGPALIGSLLLTVLNVLISLLIGF
jgi:putative membrane protein